MTTRYLYSIVHGRSTLPPQARKTLQQHGMKMVARVEVFRRPISQVINYALGKPYDELFHLGIIVTLADGMAIQIQKNAVIDISPATIKRSQYQIVPCKTPQDTTLNQMIQRTAILMGNRFLVYSSYKNNCQNFTMSVLAASDILTPELQQWIKQEKTDGVFSRNPTLRRIANTITDTAGSLDVLINGDGIQKKKH